MLNTAFKTIVINYILKLLFIIGNIAINSATLFNLRQTYIPNSDITLHITTKAGSSVDQALVPILCSHIQCEMISQNS